MYSLRRSFCTVPRSADVGTPCCLPTATTIASNTAAGALMVMLMLTLSSGMPSSSSLHIAQAADGDAYLAHFSFGEVVIGVIADLRRQVKGHGKAGLPLLDQVLVAAVAFGGVAKAGVLAHGPQPAAVHVRLDAAREGVFAGKAKPAQIVFLWAFRAVFGNQVVRGIEGCNEKIVAAGREGRAALAKAFDLGGKHIVLPGTLERLQLGGCINHRHDRFLIGR